MYGVAEVPPTISVPNSDLDVYPLLTRLYRRVPTEAHDTYRELSERGLLGDFFERFLER